MHKFGMKNFCLIVKMFLENPDVHQIESCVISQGYDLHKIQVYIVQVSYHHDNSVS